MLWSFMAVVFSGWLYVDASYRGPVWQKWLFQPITLLLLPTLAWEAPNLTASGYLIILGLLSTLIGNTILMVSSKRTLHAISAFFFSHLLYTIAFAKHITLSAYWPLPLALLIVGIAISMMLWPRLQKSRWPIVTYIGITLLMIWVAGEEYIRLGDDYSISLLLGTMLLGTAAGVWLINHYRYPFNAARGITAACYFAGHFLIVRSLYL
ncbi:lysoplasmalogenase [Candidatus Steffania adelgidicola]|uniref:lysoplasmalogenase n=1 Tax=Candidatus Steffania adelgidicola TaxID=1076626 RepID=UPI001D0348E5|nr:lysoplasmalogenase [Candidatus Steffania adelgidicola]UDG80059.1 hypothetical protein GFK82_00614 [Candidatus Steffania adelgidicola]